MINFSTSQDLQNQLHWRYATKVFDPSKTIDPETLDALLESLHMSPSSFGLQPWKFIVVSDPELKKGLRPHSWDQAQVTDCSHLVVHCARKIIDEQTIQNYIEHVANTRNMDIESLEGYKSLMLGFLENYSAEDVTNWTKRQVYISHGFLLSAAANLGVDACPMEGFSAEEYDKILGLTDYTTTVLTALGYRAKEDKYAQLPKVRFEKDDVIDMR